MNPVLVHLTLTHLPIVGTFIATVLLFFGLFGKRQVLVKASLLMLVVISLSTVPVFFSGEESEHILNKLKVVERSVIHEHEEAAELGVWFMAILGFMAAITFYFTLSGSSWKKAATVLTLVWSAFTSADFIWIGHLGGTVRHPEINAQQVEQAPDLPPPGEYEDDD